MNGGTLLLTSGSSGGHVEYYKEIPASFIVADPITGAWKRYFRANGLYVQDDALRQYKIRLRRLHWENGNLAIDDPTHDTIQVDASGGAVTITLPDPLDANFGNVAKAFTIQKWDSSANAVIIDATAGINCGLAQKYVLFSQYQSITIIPLNESDDGALNWVVESIAPGAGALRDLDSQATTAVTSEEDLNSIVIPANVLNGNFNGIKLEAWGTVASNANTKTIRLKFGSTTLISNDITTAPDGLHWHLEASIWRTGASTQEAIARATVGANNQTTTRTTPNQTETSSITAKVTGQNGTASANDIVCEGLIVEVKP